MVAIEICIEDMQFVRAGANDGPVFLVQLRYMEAILTVEYHAIRELIPIHNVSRCRRTLERGNLPGSTRRELGPRKNRGWA